VNHLPDLTPAVDEEAGVVSVRRSYPSLRTFGADVAVPTSYLTVKGEAVYFDSPSNTGDEYTIYVVELERQAGEWLLDLGYAGEIAHTSTGQLAFAAERGLTKSLIGRASLTLDTRRTVSMEAAVRRNGDGVYVKGEYTQALNQHWRITLAGVALGGDPDSFLGQYKRNSHMTVKLRASF
jgi:hypothetical protein